MPMHEFEGDDNIELKMPTYTEQCTMWLKFSSNGNFIEQ
jgi:hypothetical protein